MKMITLHFLQSTRTGIEHVYNVERVYLDETKVADIERHSAGLDGRDVHFTRNEFARFANTPGYVVQFLLPPCKAAHDPSLAQEPATSHKSNK